MKIIPPVFLVNSLRVAILLFTTEVCDNLHLDPSKHSMKTLPEDFGACVHDLSRKLGPCVNKRQKLKVQELSKEDYFKKYTK